MCKSELKFNVFLECAYTENQIQILTFIGLYKQKQIKLINLNQFNKFD